MSGQVDLERLPRYQERTFLPADACLQDADTVVSFFHELIDRDIASVDDFEQWVGHCSELADAVDQEGSILYIKMTCDTLNAQFTEDYKNFIQDVVPAVKPLSDELNRKFLHCNAIFQLDPNRYRIFERNIKADVELFCSENVPLETDVQLLSQEYQSVCGAMTVHLDGRDQTMPEMAVYQLSTDRVVREAAWRAVAERRMEDHRRLEDIFSAMCHLRHTIARGAGFSNFMDYQFKAYHRFDYQPEHCKRYHDAVQSCVVPVWQRILKQRHAQLGVQSLRPWDLSVDTAGRDPLKPFADVTALIAGVDQMFMNIDPDLGSQFGAMAAEGLLDLASRKGKAPGGYQNTLSEARKPFIFMNAVGVDGDVRTLLHEGGHAFHAMACAGDPLHAYRQAPMEFCEVASMSMELLGNHFLSAFYHEQDAQRSIRDHLESVIHLLAWVANVDAFQHWIYENPENTAQERGQKWVELYQAFNGTETDWSGLQPHLEILWHRQLHIFEVPFYYIEYGIAQLGALQIWKNAKIDWRQALEKYKRALALGGSRALPELFATAGLEFDFSERTIAPLVEELVQELHV